MKTESCTHDIKIERLTTHHAAELLAFEISNRKFFEQLITPRPAQFYSLSGVQEHIDSLLEDFKSGMALPALLIQHNAIVGRVNLKNIDPVTGIGEVGYRIAQLQQGKGLASLGVDYLSRTAISEFGLNQLTALVLRNNPASSRVLEKSGFVFASPSTHVEVIQNEEISCDQWVKYLR
ncbi:GNAT family N-acetyltransferase [Alteromonas sp. ASW11-130]|uniref:GNAT family N-acetyltransferase n=1 Tax=Alteromonas sp. ASW11-130 TaxID=3015775 RepID=UPI0022424680|nr:GNAT family N-acetyltransferase [Alteromonas sp. ASW11-130]MCW8093173.1 GNAT family N-acetyltransferase [Alteromonas sp. ASW11-130]